MYVYIVDIQQSVTTISGMEPQTEGIKAHVDAGKESRRSFAGKRWYFHLRILFLKRSMTTSSVAICGRSLRGLLSS